MRLRENDLMVREIDGETVVLDLAGSTYFASNQTGTFLLRLLNDEQDRDALVNALAREFDIDLALATADTDAFVASLNERGLLV